MGWTMLSKCEYDVMCSYEVCGYDTRIYCGLNSGCERDAVLVWELRRMGERRWTQSVRGGGTEGGRDTVRRSGRDAKELLGGGWREAPSLISGGACTATKGKGKLSSFRLHVRSPIHPHS